MKKKYIILFALFFILQFSFSNEKTINLTSLDWAPYTGEKLSHQGMTTFVVTKAFEAEGYKLKVDFYPWQRTVDLAKRDNDYVGYFPEYYSKDLEDEFYFSDPIGEGPLGFVERKNNSIKWDKLDDLKKYTIGTVKGYVNTEAFDKMVADNEIDVDAVNYDVLNIKKVSAGRIPLAVIDKNVLEYNLISDPNLAKIKDKVQFNSKILENKKIYICFKKNETGKKNMEIFNRGLKKIDIKKLEKEYKDKMLKK